MAVRRKLGRATAHRNAMLRAMVTFLLENGKIETTICRAKEVRSLTEKMITLAKVDSLHNKRLALSFITKEAVVKKLFDEIAPQYVDRNGGYTRITKLGPRRGDAAEMAIIELIPVEKPQEETPKDNKKAKKSTKAKKQEEKKTEDKKETEKSEGEE